jgi:hypothetical protein
MVQAKISEMFAPELNAGIRVFSGGKDLIDIADMAAEERDSILYCFDSNVKKVENISPKLAASLRPQRDAMVKFAQIAKGTFPETKTYSYPGQSGGLACDFLTPYLYTYATIKDGSAAGSYCCNGYTDSVVAGYGTWDATLVAGTTFNIAGIAGGKAYRGSAIAGKHSYVVIFQDGIIELGTTPKIEQLFFKSELLDKYTPISMQPLLNQSVEEGRSIYQYSTPGMIPMSHQTGAYISALANYSGVSNIPLLGMVFYETDFNLAAPATWTIRGAALA